MAVLIYLDSHRPSLIDAPQCTGNCSQGDHACDCDTGTSYGAPIELDDGRQAEPSRLREFLSVYRADRRHHSIGYALRTAWRVAVVGAYF